ncbi:MAG: extracellular solute-binding protein [Armatimonadota bacterium]
MRRYPLFILLFALLAIFVVSGCENKESAKQKLVVWGLQSSDESKGLDAVVAEFERMHTDIDVKVLSMGAGGTNQQKLLTAIAGNVPPDVIRQDRFFIGDWASRDAFIPLDDLVNRDRNKPDGVRKEDYYPACWNEAIYKKKLYAIACNTDDRALYYNRTLFRKAGLDPDRPPRTWDELKVYAKKLTIFGENKSFKQVGYIPMWGNSFLHIYAFANNGEFMSPDGLKCTLNDKRSVEALDFMKSFYDDLGGVDAVNAFAAGFKVNELDPFVTGMVAMKIDGNWVLNNIARYAPDLDFAVAPAPVPTARYEGKPPFTKKDSQFITWSGGFSYAVPRGAKDKEMSWTFIKWMLSPEANRIFNREQKKYNLSRNKPFVPEMTANVKINEMIFNEFAPKNPRFRKPLRQFIDLMQVSKWRPTTFVGQRLWDEQLRAIDQATRNKKSSADALGEATTLVQKELDKILSRSKYSLLDWKYPAIIILLMVCVLGYFTVRVFRQYGPIGKLSQGEAVAGYLFASPWIIGFLVFTIGPIVASIILSFCDYDVLHPARWVGITNYYELLTDDWHYMSKALYNAGYLALFGLPLGLFVSLSIAMLLNTKVNGMTWYRTMYYLPSIVPVVANLILWMWVLNPEFGLLNAAWKATLTNWFHIAPPAWLSSEIYAKPALIIMGLWGAGGGMILWLAGLQGVPQHLYEAAEIDGAGWWSRFWNVTFPMLTPYLFFNLIMGTIGVLQSFEAQYIMTNGGPADATLVPVLYLFNNAFSYFKMGYASALAWILFIIILTLSLIQLKMAPRWVHYEHDKGR